MSSVAAFTGGIVGPHYATAKAGLIGLMHSLAASLAPYRITVNVVAPALIESDALRDIDVEARRELAKRMLCWWAGSARQKTRLFDTPKPSCYNQAIARIELSPERTGHDEYRICP
jgi:NAD(P)-dependent dehydrogenase (short-subunit alcohol dehydrogenase family)